MAGTSKELEGFALKIGGYYDHAHLLHQMQHHASEPFQDEYLRLLEKHEVDYDPKYVWD